MRLINLHLRNFCQHVDRVVEFAPGLTAITGPNGCGKSNVLAALNYALLGVDPNFGKLTDSINWSARRDDPAFVKLTFTHGENAYSVTRNLRGDTPVLTCNEQELVRGAEAVTARILETLGVTKTLVEDYIIVHQGNVASWFSKSVGARATEIANLLGLDTVEKLHTALGPHISAIEVPTLFVDTDALLQRQAQLTAELQAQELTVVQQPRLYDIAILQADQVRAIQTVQQFESQQRQLADHAVAQRDLEAVQQAIDAEQQRVTAAQQRHDQLIEQAAMFDAATVTFAREQLAAWDKFNGAAAAREAADRVTSQLASLSWLSASPPRSVEQTQVDEYAEEKKRADAACIRLQQQLDTAQQLQVGAECPTCDEVVTPTSKHTQKLRALEHQLREQNDLANAATNRWRLMSDMRTAWVDHEAKLRQHEALETQLATFLEMAQQAPKPTLTAADAQAILQGADEHAKQFAASERDLSMCSIRLEEREQTCASYRARLAELAARTAVCVTNEEYAEAVLVQRGYSARLQDCVAMQKEIAKLQEQLTWVAETLETARRIEADRRRALAAKEHMTAVRGVLHKDAAPRMLILQQLSGLCSKTNDILLECGMSFTVEATDKCQLRVHFPGGSTVDRRLSGGQLSMLGLIFRTAKAAAMLRDVGLLVLDEPTEFIDEENKGRLPLIFRRLGNIASVAGLQLIVITHDSPILSMFDRTIDLN